jgi:hypothetical protein
MLNIVVHMVMALFLSLPRGESWWNGCIAVRLRDYLAICMCGTISIQ